MSIASGKTLTYGITGGRLVFTLNGTATINGNFAFDAGTTVRNFTVNNGATLIVTPTGRVYDPNISAGSVFILNSGATLKTAKTGGISTGTTTDTTVAVNFGGSYTYSTGANYEYNGTSAQVTGSGLTQNTPANVTINNAAGVTLSQNTTLSGSLSVTAGTFTVGAFALTVGGTTPVSGTLAITSSTGAKLFTGLVTINSGGIWNNSGNSAVTFRGGITNNGTFTAGTGIQSFTTNSQALNGTFSIPSVTVTTPTTLTNNGSLTVGTALAGTGGLTNAATGTLNLNFTGALGITTLTASAAGNTVNYGYAGTQTVKGTTYSNLTLSNSGAKTTTGITVNGTLSMQGTATASAAPTYGAGATLEYKGSAVQTTGPELTATVPNMTINNSNGVTLNGSATVNGALTLSNGKVTTGANTLSIGSAGSVSGAGAGNYVFGNLRRTFLTGAQSFTFDIGDASNYTPAAISFANITTGGTLTAKSTAGDHPQIGTSTIIPTHSVNRYWTLTSGGGLAFSTYNSTFTFVPGDIDAGSNTASFIAGNYNGSTWSYPTVGTRTSTSTQVTGITALGDFALGNSTTYTITASAGANGTINPSGTVNVNYNTSQAFTFTPSTGYHVDSIYVDGAYAGNSSGYTFNNVVANHTISVTFAINKYTITASAGANGVINPSGSVSVNYNTSQAFTFTPSTGYHVDSIYVDGAYAGNGAGYTFNNVVANHSISVTFAINQFTITATTGGNGAINPSGSVLVNYNASQPFSFTPSTGYHVDSIYVDGAYAGNGSGYTFNNVVANHSISVTFAINQFTVSASAGANGAISPNGSVVVNYGANQAFTITPNANYKVDTLLVDGVKVDSTSSYTFTDVTSNHSIAVTFKNIVYATSSHLFADFNPSVYGQTVTFTDSVVGSGPAPSGTVIFTDGLTVLDTAVVNSGVATFQTSALNVGGHAISGLYSGDANHNGSTSNVLSDTVNKAGTTTSVGADVNPSVYGQTVNFTATISVNSPGVGTPTGNVQFFDGATSLGMVAIGGNLNKPQAGLKSSIKSVTTQVVKGVKRTVVDVTASLPVSTLSAGVHSITAVYLDDANFTGSTSGVLSDTVNNSNTNVALGADVNPSVYGQPVTFTATVTNNGTTPSGTVIFMDGATVLDTATMNGSGVATFQTSALSVGGHAISGLYSGDANHNGSTSNVLSDTVNKASTTTSVGADVNPSVYGQTVNFTATISVTSPGDGAPTGNVQFFDGATSLGTVAIGGGANKPQAGLKSAIKSVTTQVVKGVKRNVVDVTASLPVSTLSAGVHSITAVYLDDANFTGSTSGVLSDTVNNSNTNVALGADVNPSVYGQPVTFTATVTNNGTTPSGTIIFMDGATVLDTATMDGSGVATFQTSGLSVGGHAISGLYSGDANHNSSTSNVLSDTVNKASTTTSVAPDVNPSMYGQTVNFTATISVTSPGDGTPTGNVQFFDGATSLGTVAIGGANKPLAGLKSTLKVVKGTKRTVVDVTASLGVSSLSAGAHSITAVYLDDANFTGSTSGVLSDTVNNSNTNVALGADVNPSVYGQPVTFTATVTNNGTTPSGTVIFMDGATVLDTATMNGSGVATFQTSALSVGGHAISGLYSGDANHNSSTSNVLSDTVNKAATTTSVGADVNPSVYGQTVNFTATISVTSPGDGTPTGNVQFFDGATSLGTVAIGGVNKPLAALKTTLKVVKGVKRTVVDVTTSLPVSTLSAGVHSITAVYLDDANFTGSTSGVLSDTVNNSNTNVALGADVNPSVYGQPVTFTATVTNNGTTPSGTVIFMDGATVLDTATMNGSGVATFQTSGLSVGGHAISGLYSGDANHNSSTSNVLSDTVNKASTTTSVGADVNPSVYGQTVNFTATISVTSPGTGTPTGNVQFFDGATSLGTVAIGGANKPLAGLKSPLKVIPSQVVGKQSTSGIPAVTAHLSLSTLNAGVHSITAVYLDDANFTGSTSGVLSDTVNKANTTTALSASSNSSFAGDLDTLTVAVNVVAPGSGIPTGNVIFMDGSTVIDTTTLTRRVRDVCFLDGGRRRSFHHRNVCG